jgi:hypothetical protein
MNFPNGPVFHFVSTQALALPAVLVVNGGETFHYRADTFVRSSWRKIG